MKKISKVSAPGKLILSGEHAVVYGYPALVTAINRRLSIDKKGKIESDIPMGAGMGSSAALAVAKSALRIGKIDLEKINALAYKIEIKHHGKPSGADNTISTFGGFLWYRKEAESLKTFKSLQLLRKIPQIYILNTGRPEESTREMVETIARLYKRKKVFVEAIFRQIEGVTKEFLRYFLNESSSDFGELIRKNEMLLEDLGVVSALSRQIVRKIERIGGSAKISGAGGIKKASGVLIVYHKNSQKLLKFAEKNKMKLRKIKMGEEGVRIEKE